MAEFSVQDWKAIIIVGLVIVGYIIALTAWLIRLEAKILYIEKDQQKKTDSDKIMWDKIDDMQNGMSGIQQSLSRIEGKLEVTFRNISK